MFVLNIVNKTSEMSLHNEPLNKFDIDFSRSFETLELNRLINQKVTVIEFIITTFQTFVT